MSRLGSELEVGENAWKAHIEAQQKSGLSVRAYCEKHNLEISSFYYRKGRLNKAPRFVEVVATCQTGASGVEVAVGEGLRVCVARGFDEQTLVRVVRALQGGGPSC